MGIRNQVNGVFVSGGPRKLAVIAEIDKRVKAHLGTKQHKGLCLSLVGHGEDNFVRHVGEHISLGCDIDNFVYVDNLEKVAKALVLYKQDLYPDSKMRIVHEHMIWVLRDLVAEGKKISVLDHDGTSNYDEDTEEAIELGAKAGAEIMIFTVASRMKDLTPFLQKGWKAYNNCKRECNHLHHKPNYQRGIVISAWPPVLCNKPVHYKHKPAKPVRNIQASMMNKKAEELGYEFSVLPYTGGDGKGIPMMVGLFLKKK